MRYATDHQTRQGVTIGRNRSPVAFVTEKSGTVNPNPLKAPAYGCNLGVMLRVSPRESELIPDAR